jgi:tripartite-type tricarboxylate transporter receptor subunit TctC
MEMLKSAAGIDLLHVPYRTVSEMTLSVVAGQTHVTFAGATAIEFVKKGDVRALAQTGQRRFKRTLADVPTMQEAGVPDYLALTWYSLLAPRETPRPILDKIERDVLSVLSDKDVINAFENIGQDVVGMGSVEFAKFMDAERRRWEKVVKASNAKVD